MRLSGRWPAFRFVILSEDWSLRDERKEQPQRRIPAIFNGVSADAGRSPVSFAPLGLVPSYWLRSPTACALRLRSGQAVGCILALLRSFPRLAGRSCCSRARLIFCLCASSHFYLYLSWGFFSCECWGLGLGARARWLHAHGWLARGDFGRRGGFWLLWRCAAARYFCAGAWTDECVRRYV